jgi:ABC-2 type transport system ATP-binding protein
VVSGELDDLRAQYQRIQLVFDGDAPDFRIHAPGTHRLQRRGRAITILSAHGGAALLDELRGYRPSSIDVSPVSLKDIFLESVRTED